VEKPALRNIFILLPSQEDMPAVSILGSIVHASSVRSPIENP